MKVGSLAGLGWRIFAVNGEALNLVSRDNRSNASLIAVIVVLTYGRSVILSISRVIRCKFRSIRCNHLLSF